MNQTIINHFHSWGYQAFKYLIYTLLAFNVYLFFQEEWLASNVIFEAGLSFDTLIKGFSSTIDTAAWLVLLLLFELETYVLDDDKITGSVKRSLHGVRALCYLIIIYAFYGYLSKVGLLAQFVPHQISDLCTLASDWKFMETLNVYTPFTTENCLVFSKASTEFFVYSDFKVIASATTLSDTKMLSWVDVINSGAWLSVVLMLEIDVRMQLSHVKKAQLKRVLWDKYNIYVKVIVYGILLLAAIYWGVTGNFIEFWDAFLWLLAFVLIEMNMFEWQAEIADKNKVI
ncbi:MAG: hypothetical protein HRT38_08730 [Alteromonadaceae bacterium]|nr:hypothetical protein [Alteromonadaceae bacterium]